MIAISIKNILFKKIKLFLSNKIIKKIQLIKKYMKNSKI